MKNRFVNLSYTAALLVYFMLAPAVIFLAVLGCVSQGEDIQYCLSDVFCYVEHHTKYSLFPVILLLLIIFLKGQFRAAVIIRYEKVSGLILSVIKRVSGIALTMTVYQTLLTVLLGLQFAAYSCSWNKVQGFPFHLVGAIIEDMPSTIFILLLYMSCVFMTIVVAGLFMAVCWWLTQTPVSGYMLLIVLLVLEQGDWPDVFFGILSMEPMKIFLEGIHPQEFTAYPFFLILILFAAGVLIVKKRDFIRIR